MNKNTVKSASQDFSKTVNASIERSKFNRNSTLLTTFNPGDLVPIYLDEVYPGDTFVMGLDHVARLITPLTPTMDNLNIEFYAFFVPHRIVWDGWEELMGENKTDAWTPTSLHEGVPQYDQATAVLEDLAGDHYGLPVGMIPSDHAFSVLPFRGYRLIWNEWFRDQNLQAPLTILLEDVSAAAALTHKVPLVKVNKPHDYFTSCLPSPQKSVSDVLIPIDFDQFIPIVTLAALTDIQSTEALQWYVKNSKTSVVAAGSIGVESGGDTNLDESETAVGDAMILPSNLWANPSGIELNNTTINDLRTAFQIQKMYERDARGGTRYVDYLKAHFGVDAMDYRLQRPEFLGASKNNISINQVTDAGAGTLGDVAGFGHSQGSDMLFNKSFTEHGYVHIFAVSRQKKSYHQGLERHWSRHDRLDFYHPVLAHISEQPVYSKEIFAVPDGTGPVGPEVVFGYQEAWADLRYKTSKINGAMRTGHADSFDIWHYADDYDNPVTLSDSWIQDNSLVNVLRTVAIQTTDLIKLNCLFKQIATRPLPTHSIPGYIDHF